MQLTQPLIPGSPTTALIPVSGGPTMALQPYQAAGVTTALIPVQMMPQPPHPTTGGETIISVQDVIEYVRQYWKRGLILALPAAAVVFLYLGFGQPVFEAESKLKINIQDRSVLDVNGQPQTGLSELSAPMIINNHRTGLKSRRFVDYLFTKLTPSERTAFIGETGKLGLKSRIFIALGLSDPPKATAPEELFAVKMDKAVRIEPVKESHILRIQLRDGSAQRAAELANQYVNFYIEYVADDNLSGMRRAFEVLQTESEQLKESLERKQRDLADFRKSADILGSNPKGEVDEQRVASLVSAVTETEVALLKAQIDLNEMRRVQAGGEVAAVKGMGTDLQIIELRKVRDEVSTKRSALLEWCGPRHPKVLAYDEDLRRMAEQEHLRVKELVATAEAEEARLKSQHDQLKQQLAAARGEVFDRDSKHMENDFLTEDAKTDRELYNQVLLRKKQTELAAEMKDSAQLSVADVAVPPDSAVSPRKSIAFLASLMVLGFLGLAVPVGSGLWRDHVMPLLSSMKGKGSNEVGQPPAPQTSPFQQVGSPFSPAPEPQVVPNASAWGQTSFQQAAAPVSQPLHQPQPNIIATIPELMAAEGPIQLGELLHSGTGGSSSGMAQIAAVLEKHRMMRGGQGAGVILVTSASTSEGKSLLASALAASLCTSGRHVFLMECNPASPSIQNWFPQAGTYSSWTNDLETLRYGASNLFLLPAHDLPSYEVSDLLDGYRAWISKASHEVDWIVLDGASLLRGFADVAQLAHYATDVLFIHDETRTTSDQVRAALNLIRPLVRPEAMRGMVINRHAT
ncbi:MAG: hypothetical protein JNJ83_11480 [Verrucomicrobiaceae bacterium]|nr:hypothetical protein [Verrucomicrobiaceae bacterium]